VKIDDMLVKDRRPTEIDQEVARLTLESSGRAVKLCSRPWHGRACCY